MRPHNVGPHACSVQSMRPSNTLSLYVYNYWHSLGGAGQATWILSCNVQGPITIALRSMYVSFAFVASAMLAKVISPAAPGGPAKRPSCFSHCLGNYTVFAHMWLAILESANFATSNLSIQIRPSANFPTSLLQQKRQAKRVPSRALDRVASTRKHHISSRPAKSSVQGKFRGPPRNAIETRKNSGST